MTISRTLAKPIGNAFVDLQHRDGLPKRWAERVASMCAIIERANAATKFSCAEFGQAWNDYRRTRIKLESTKGNSDGELEQRQPR
jgi:hypothetical protein